MATWREVEHHLPAAHAQRIRQNAHDALLLFARVLLALMFVRSGFGKLLDVGAFGASLADKGVPFAAALAVIGGCAEFFVGLAVLLGLQTRYAAALVAVFTVVATLISHRYWEFSGAARRAQEVNFQKNVCIIGGYLALVASGGGRFTLDGLFRKSAKSSQRSN
jgi:putative oxidoreductase